METPDQILDRLAETHQQGHRCEGGIWHNPQVRRGDWCQRLRDVSMLRVVLTAYAAQVHDAAHDPDAVRAVAQGMTGFDLTVDGGLDDDVRGGWLHTAQLGIEALAAWLDPTIDDE